jgi:hypothetical protein
MKLFRQTDALCTAIPIGRRKRDFGVIIEWLKGQCILRVPTADVGGGVYLEDVPPGPGNKRVGMVLARCGDPHLYFLIEREGWTPAQYWVHFENLYRKHLARLRE